MSARDLARFGILYLKRGRLGADQLLTANWIRESTVAYSHTGNQVSGSEAGVGYGYLWWADGGIGNAGLDRHLVRRKTPKFRRCEDVRGRQILWSALAYAATVETEAEGQAEQHSARIATVLTCDDDNRTPHVAEFSSSSRCRAAWLLLSGTLHRVIGMRACV